MTTAQDRAAEHDRKAAESFERCDTDGFVTQAAHGINARLERLQDKIDKAGGTASFAGLFDAEDNRVKAKLVLVDNFQGTGKDLKWLVLDANDNPLHWIARPQDPLHPSKRSKMGQLGLREDLESAPGTGGMFNLHPAIRRTDKGYPEGAVIMS